MAGNKDTDEGLVGTSSKLVEGCKIVEMKIFGMTSWPEWTV